MENKTSIPSKTKENSLKSFEQPLNLSIREQKLMELRGIQFKNMTKLQKLLWWTWKTNQSNKDRDNIIHHFLN